MSGDQLSRAELKQMPAEEIVTAHREGRLDEIMAGRDPGRPSELFTPPGDADQGARGRTYGSAREWLQSLSPDEVARFLREGALDDLLRGER